MVKGRRIPTEDLTDHEWGLHISEGTRFYEAVQEECSHCGGTGRRRWWWLFS